MVKKKDFIKRILQRLEKRLLVVLPNESPLDEMYDKLEEILNEEFLRK